jgi:hypothetical protein
MLLTLVATLFWTNSSPIEACRDKAASMQQVLDKPTACLDPLLDLGAYENKYIF